MEDNNEKGIAGDTIVWQIIKGQKPISHKLSDLKLEKIIEINNKITELYKDINEEDRFYQNDKEALDEKTILEFYELARKCYENAGIKKKYDDSQERIKEDWIICDYFKNNRNHKNKIIKISNFGRVKIDGIIAIQDDISKDKGELQIKAFGTTLKVWTLIAETWLEKDDTQDESLGNWEVHHLSNNGYDQRPENLIWIRSSLHRLV